jgi:hypothetical protein
MSIDFLYVLAATSRYISAADQFRIPDDVINYIYEHNLYQDMDLSSNNKGKEKEETTAGSSSR